MRIVETQVCVSTSFVGYHRWGDAPRSEGYLAVAHRHKFGVELCVRVSDDRLNARVVEFHDLLKKLNAFISRQGWVDYSVFSEDSCETMASKICSWVYDEYEIVQVATCSVSEDGECRSLVKTVRYESNASNSSACRLN